MSETTPTVKDIYCVLSMEDLEQLLNLGVDNGIQGQSQILECALLVGADTSMDHLVTAMRIAEAGYVSKETQRKLNDKAAAKFLEFVQKESPTELEKKVVQLSAENAMLRAQLQQKTRSASI